MKGAFAIPFVMPLAWYPGVSVGRFGIADIMQENNGRVIDL